MTGKAWLHMTPVCVAATKKQDCWQAVLAQPSSLAINQNNILSVQVLSPNL